MLRTIEDLQRYDLQASDGAVGRVHDLFFDDTSWAIRYLVVKTGTWLLHQDLLISPFGTGLPDWQRKILTLAWTRDEVRRDPDHCNVRRVARQLRTGYIGPPGMPYQKAGPGSWSMIDRFDASPALARRAARADPRTSPAAQGPPQAHLHSCNTVNRCVVRARDGVIGPVRGMLVEEETWMVRFLIVDAAPDGPGRQVLIAPPWILEVDWPEASIRVDLTRAQVAESATYQPSGGSRASQLPQLPQRQEH